MVVVAGGINEYVVPEIRTELLELAFEEWQLGPQLPKGNSKIYLRLHVLTAMG